MNLVKICRAEMEVVNSQRVWLRVGVVGVIMSEDGYPCTLRGSSE